MIPKIPPNRLLMYLLVLGLVPLFLSFFWVYNQHRNVELLQIQIASLRDKIHTHIKTQGSNLNIVKRHQNADHFYLDKHLETIEPLEHEMIALREVSNEDNYAGLETVDKRLKHLEHDNHLLFSESPVQKGPFFQETVETMTKPVEINIDDLKKVLASIEGKPYSGYLFNENRPQLLILEFQLDRKKEGEEHETFLLNMKFLKREFL